MTEFIYEINRWSFDIREHVLVGETQHFVTYETEWAGKKSTWRAKKEGCFYHSRKEAEDELLARAHRAVKSANSALDSAEGVLGEMIRKFGRQL